jgi:dihydrofolate reductase
MRKIIAAMNMTLDGYCDHTAMTADDEIHEHYNDVMRQAGLLIYGRVTYQLMESYWPLVVANPTGNKPMDDFAVLIDNVPKLVYSRTLTQVDWKNTVLKNELIVEDLLELRQKGGRDIYVGSPGMIAAFSRLGLIDEYQLGLNPVIVGSGLTLFKNITGRIDLHLMKTKTFGCGAIMLYYETRR